MNRKNRYLVAAASLVLILVFLFPLWKISISAPQYPEGMGLVIWVNKITGEMPQDLKIINVLNHYIGMKPITPETIPELKIMPIIVIFFMLTGLAVAFKGNKKVLLAWLILFVIAGLVGIYDFYSWEYNYGHNLNSNAPIKVPGMSYQPPLIGSKQLLNIRALSMPHIGGYAIFVSIFLASLAYFFETKTTKDFSK